MAKKVKSLAAASSFAERAGSGERGGGGGLGARWAAALRKSELSIKADDAKAPLIITSPVSTFYPS